MDDEQRRLLQAIVDGRLSEPEQVREILSEAYDANRAAFKRDQRDAGLIERASQSFAFGRVVNDHWSFSEDDNE